jgi:hypothetical protein
MKVQRTWRFRINVRKIKLGLAKVNRCHKLKAFKKLMENKEDIMFKLRDLNLMDFSDRMELSGHKVSPCHERSALPIM